MKRNAFWRADSVGLFILAAAIAALMAYLFPFIVSLDGRYETLNVARSLVQTGTFANPFQLGATGPTAHVAPVFPAIAAALMYLPLQWKNSLLIFGIVLCGLNAAFLPCAAETLLGNRRAGLYAGFFSVFSVALMPQADAALNSFLGLFACCAMVTAIRGWWLISGIAVLANPIAILPIAVFGVHLGRRYLLLATLGVTLVCGPWVVRNFLVLGFPAPVRDNFGLELSIANNDCSSPTFFENLRTGCFQASHPNFSRREFSRIRALGELQYNNLHSREAISWIKYHRERFLSLTGTRALYYLFPSILQGPWAFGIWILTVISALSLCFVRNRTVRILQMCAAVSWLPYAFIQSDLRYRTGSIWCWLLLAGFVLCEASLADLAKKLIRGGFGFLSQEESVPAVSEEAHGGTG